MIKAYIPENLVNPVVHYAGSDSELLAWPAGNLEDFKETVQRKPGQDDWILVIEKETLVEYEAALTELLEILSDNHGELVASTSVIQVND